jgi:hypothetical protein
MELNYNSGNNGKRADRDEVIPMNMDIHDMKDSDIAKDVLRYIAKKAEFRPREKKEEGGEVLKGRKTVAAERKAFLSLSKKPEPKLPEGTVGARLPMEVRVKQLSLFPGIY